jgi:hypothetical protein
MDEQELYSAIAARTGASAEEVAAVVREAFPQAFAMAMERPGGTLVVPHFATFRCRPGKSGRMRFAFQPRLPNELIHAGRLREQKLAAHRRPGPGFKPRPAARLSGAAYVPAPLAPPGTSAAPGARKGGFLARLLGLRS